jgi:hypothetical protein
MAQQAQLHNKFLAIILLCIVACKAPVKPVDGPELLFINSAAANFSNVNGVVYLNNHLFSGKVFTLYPNSNDTAAIAGYLNGKEHGVWKKFYANEVLKEKRVFENGKKTGEYITWWESGNKQQQFIFKDDEYEGTCSEWNSNGVLIKAMNYKKGHEEGQQQLFYDNGKIRSNYFIINGRRYGLLGTKNCVNVSDSIFLKQ